MGLLPDWAPGIHPLIIHFPIALLALAVGLTVLDLFYSQKWLQNATLGLYVLGSVSALAAYFSGRDAADSIGLNLKAEVAIGTHSDWGLYTLMYFGLLTLTYFVVKFILKQNTMTIRVLLAIMAMAGFFILAQTADYGGRLVFEYGLGVKN